MKLRDVDVRNFKGYKETKLQSVLLDFQSREIPVAEGEYKNNISVYATVKASINRFKMNNLVVKMIDKKVYIINKILFEKAVEEV